MQFFKVFFTLFCFTRIIMIKDFYDQDDTKYDYIWTNFKLNYPLLLLLIILYQRTFFSQINMMVKIILEKANFQLVKNILEDIILKYILHLNLINTFDSNNHLFTIIYIICVNQFIIYAKETNLKKTRHDIRVVHISNIHYLNLFR